MGAWWIGSKLQKIVTLSSTEAEFVAAAELARDVKWFRGLLQELKFKVGRSLMFEDNQSCIKFAEMEFPNKRTRHIEVRQYFLKEMMQQGELAMAYIPTQFNLADLLTKELNKNSFH